MTARRAPARLATLWALALLAIAAWPASTAGAASVVYHQGAAITGTSSSPAPVGPPGWVTCHRKGPTSEAHLEPFHEAWPAPAAITSHLPSVERTSASWVWAAAALPDGDDAHPPPAHAHRWRLHDVPGASQCASEPPPARAPPLDLVPA